MEFRAIVSSVRSLGDHDIISVSYKPEGAKYPSFHDLKFPAGTAPAVEKNDAVVITAKYAPSARGYKSKNLDPSGEPYINAAVVWWKPEVKVQSAPNHAQKPEFEEDIPFHHVPDDQLGWTSCGHSRF